MQNLTLTSLMWIFCILGNIIQAIMTIFHQKIRQKIQFKYYSVLFFVNLILITVLFNFLLFYSQDNAVVIFGIIEIVFLQVVLLFYVNKIRNSPPDLGFFFFSIFLFGSLRISGEYHFFQQIILEELLEDLSLFSFVYFEFLFVLCSALMILLVLWLLIRIFNIKAKFQLVFSSIWFCLSIFAFTFFVDMLFLNFGIGSVFFVDIWPFIGYQISMITYGVIFQYAFLFGFITLTLIILGYKSREGKFSNPSFKPMEKLKRGIIIGLGTVGVLGLLFILFSATQFTLTIVDDIAKMFEYDPFFLSHPFWFFAIIYLILLVIPLYIGYLSYVIIKNRKKLWEQPNSFNTTPFLNLIVLVASGFIVCYFELIPPTPLGFFWIEREFILFIAFFYLSTFLVLFVTYIFTFHKKQWLDLSYSLKISVIYLPFVIGFFLAGQILTVTEFIIGIMACTSLQLCMLYLRKYRNDPASSSEKRLNFFIVLLWGVLATAFAGLLSIISMICILISIAFLLGITYPLRLKNIKVIIYGVILGGILIMGGISETFLTTLVTYGFPNTYVLWSAFSIIILSIIFYGVKRLIR